MTKTGKQCITRLILSPGLQLNKVPRRLTLKETGTPVSTVTLPNYFSCNTMWFVCLFFVCLIWPFFLNVGTKVPPKTKNEDPGSNSQDSSPPGEWCRALHSFTAETSEDLAFKRGDRILILERLDSDWYRGRLHGKEGIFPAVFVQPCPAEAKSVASTMRKGKKVKALYDFVGENEDELSFKAGDVITELEPVDDDWMRGELMGKAGIFPKNYVQFLQVSWRWSLAVPWHENSLEHSLWLSDICTIFFLNRKRSI